MKKLVDGQFKQSLLFNVFIPALFIICVLCLMPIQEVFQFDTDEGIELSRATLYSQGLLTNPEVWNDHPIFFSAILSNWLNLFGNSIFAARLLVVSFATLLVWSFSNTLRICLGTVPALVGTFLLCISCNFLRLSISLMIGMPSLALAMVSVYTLILYQHRRKLYLIILSGTCLALSLQIKMFTIFIIPVLLWQILDVNFQGQKYELFNYRFFSAIFWLSSLLVIFLLTGIFLEHIDLENSILFHISGDLKSVYQQNSWWYLTLMFLQDFDYLLLSIVGVRVIMKKREWVHKLPLIWLGVVTLLLINHKPIWYHHYLLISIPLTWLATYGATLALSYFQKPDWHLNFKLSNFKQPTLQGVAAGFLIFSLIVVPIKLTVIQWENNAFVQKNQDKLPVLERITEYKPFSNYIFTDMAIYAFYSQINLPPEIAVLSRKRVGSENINQSMLISILEKYHPEQIVLARFPEIYNLISPYLEEKYTKIYSNNSTKHYILRKIKEQY